MQRVASELPRNIVLASLQGHSDTPETFSPGETPFTYKRPFHSKMVEQSSQLTFPNEKKGQSE